MLHLALVFAVKEGPKLLNGGGADWSTSSGVFFIEVHQKKSQSMNIPQEIFH